MRSRSNVRSRVLIGVALLVVVATGATAAWTSIVGKPVPARVVMSPWPLDFPSPAPIAGVTPSAPPPAWRPTATHETLASCVDPATWPVAARLEELLVVSGKFADLGASDPEARAGVGGFVFFGQPAANDGPAIAYGLAVLRSDAAAGGRIAPWMTTDEEGGSVQRLVNVAGSLPSARQMAAQWTPAQVQAALTAHAVALRNLGVDVDLAPVVDTANPADFLMDENERSFSEDGSVAAAYGIAYSAGLRAGGVVAVIKHFPGLGHANADTDLEPALDPSLAQLRTDDLIPFQRAIAAGAPVVMVSHAEVPGLSGTTPASLSPATYQLLRGLGFRGVAMTDSLQAGAISGAGYSQPAAALAALTAGADMAMIDASTWSATVSALTAALSTGRLSLTNVNASVRRVLAAKGIRVCG